MTLAQRGPGRSLPAALCALSACAAPRIDKPEPPDLRELLQRFESPTGSFAAEDSALVGEVVRGFQQVVGNTDIVARVTELLGDVTQPLAAGGEDEPPEPGMGGDDPPELSLRADGYLVATRICPGWELPSVVDAANGTVRVTATFTEAGLDPVVWGTVSACRYRAAGSRIELTPSSERDALRVYWGEAVRRSAAALGADAGKGAAAGVVLSLALRATVEGAPLSLDLDLRLAEGNALEYLLPAGGGWVVVQASGEGSFAVRSIEGTYACDPSFACVLNGAEVER